MDIICPKCGEPWDHDMIHERVSELNDGLYDGRQPDGLPLDSATYQSVAADFRKRGCAALGEKCPAAEDPDYTGQGGAGDLSAAEAAATIYDLLGDDMDGAAALLEDMGY